MTHKENSLWTVLHNALVARGYLSYGDVCQICAEEGYKVDTARRRLDEMSDIEPQWATGKRGTDYISGYKYKPETIYQKVDNLVNDIATLAGKAEEKMLFPSYFKQKSEIIQDHIDWRDI